ncbi:MAG: PIN domain-containing protein [Anaerolineae bacterium]
MLNNMANPLKKPRVFIDANVLLAGSAFPRWPHEVLQHATDGDFQLVLCPLVIKHTRQHLQRHFPDHLARFEKFLREVDYELVPDPTPEEIEANKNIVRDLSDVAVALAAIAAGVDYVVSEDKDLTVQDETTAELRRYMKVLLSGTFLREVMGWTNEQLEAIRYRTWSDMPEEEM